MPNEPTPAGSAAVGAVRHTLGLCGRARTITTATPSPGRDRAELVLCAGPGDDHAVRPVAGETECGECRREAAARAAGFGARPQEGAVRLTWRERVAAATGTA
ncbi:hypothetical protein ACWDZ4_20960 [Streptomyces sp. NPDC003016]